MYDGSLVREVEASAKSCVNCLSINKSGEVFVTAGSDQIVKVGQILFILLSWSFYMKMSIIRFNLALFKLWDFQTAIVLCAGAEHAANIISCKFSPCGKYVVSGSADGTIIIWKVPEVSQIKMPMSKNQI